MPRLPILAKTTCSYDDLLPTTDRDLFHSLDAMALMNCSKTNLAGIGRARTPRTVSARRVVVRAAQATPDAKAAPSPVDDVQFINPLWSQPSTEKEFLGLLAKLVEAGKCPPQLQAGWIDFYQGYKETVESSGVADAEKVATKVQATIADVVFNQVGACAMKMFGKTS